MLNWSIGGNYQGKVHVITTLDSKPEIPKRCQTFTSTLCQQDFEKYSKPYTRVNMTAEVISCTTRPDALLEGPHWDPITQSLLYVEIYSKKVHRYTPSADSVETLDVG